MREITHTFGLDCGLIGTLTLPRGRPSRMGLVLFNSGVVHRVGPHRINVKLARQLAERGVASIRFDLHGMGDSARANGALAYDAQVVCDLQDAMSLLEQHAGTQRFVLLGFCSGAQQSYLAAEKDHRVDTIVLYDAFAFHTMRSRLRFLWLRMRSQGSGVTALASYARKGVTALAGLPGSIAARLRSRSPADPGGGDQPIDKAAFARGLRLLTQKGVTVVVVHAGDDFSQVNYVRQIRDAFGRAWPGNGATTVFLEFVDHIATSTPAQRCFMDALCNIVLNATLRKIDPPTHYTGMRNTEPGSTNNAST
jgi:pimeloyl-ACP methyl ester carboxylesterase